MMRDSGGSWQARCVIPKWANASMKEHMLRELEHQVSRELYRSLQQVKNPCVVDLYTDELDVSSGNYGEPAREFRLGYRLTAVEHRHIVMPSLSYYESKPTLKPKVYTKLQKLWQRWTGSTWLV